MTALIEYPLGIDAMEYIKYYIATYGRTLSKYLLKCLDLETGRVVALLPPSIKPKQARDFESGGIIPESQEIPLMVYSDEKVGGTTTLIPLPDTTSKLITYIQTYLRRSSDRICIFENMSAKPTDPWLLHSVARIREYKDEIYAVLLGEDTGVQAIWNAIRDTKNAACLIGIMTSQLSEVHTLLTRKEVTANELLILAKRTEKIIVGAYDAESFLIWDRALLL